MGRMRDMPQGRGSTPMGCVNAPRGRRSGPAGARRGLVTRPGALTRAGGQPGTAPGTLRDRVPPTGSEAGFSPQEEASAEGRALLPSPR